MTPPTVQFIPAAAAGGPDFTISGTFDGNSNIAGAIDNNPVAVPAISGLGTVIMRGTLGQNRINLQFDTSGDGDTFQAAVPNGSTAVLIHLSTTYTAAGFSWVDFGTTLRLEGSAFDAFPSAFSNGEDYTLEFYT
jgi:hypothetical protein